MSMEELPPQAQPGRQPLILKLGELFLIFDGSPQDADAEIRVRQYMALIADQLINLRFTFAHNGQLIDIIHLYLEIESIDEGSIVARLKIVGSFTLAFYGAIAAYPSFKDAIPVIEEDLRSAIAYVREQAPDPSREDRGPRSFILNLRDEAEMISQIERQLRFSP
jgi:hypothetical protein|tara:strand:- start:1170 stop:1664 length:495 start_codon:yes stop_codon:yes gene_type:complete